MQKFKNIYSFDSQLKLIKESCHMSSRDKLTLMFQEACFAKYMNKVKKTYIWPLFKIFYSSN